MALISNETMKEKLKSIFLRTVYGAYKNAKEVIGTEES